MWMRCAVILLQESQFPFSRTIRQRDSCWWMHFRQDVEEADPEVLTGEPCASLTIEYSGVPSAESVDAMVPGRTGDYYFFACFYVFPQFKRTVEILKETGYPVSMEDVKLSAVEVEYYMNEEHNEVFFSCSLRSSRNSWKN